jgi:WXXGXW repeat (2 copies)
VQVTRFRDTEVTIMLMRKLILGGLIVATLGGVSIPAAARANVDFYVNFGPPPVRYEFVPAPRVGFVWVPGYWDWRYNRHHWVGGHWVRHRPGYFFAPARWVAQDGRWYYHAPGWRAGDRDGVPDRYDRSPDNPYRR